MLKNVKTFFFFMLDSFKEISIFSIYIFFLRANLYEKSLSFDGTVHAEISLMFVNLGVGKRKAVIEEFLYLRSK